MGCFGVNGFGLEWLHRVATWEREENKGTTK